MAAAGHSVSAAVPETLNREAPVEILPVKALPVVAVIVAAVIAAIGTNSRWALDFFHVAGGGIWTALDLFLGFVLGPILGRLFGPQSLRERHLMLSLAEAISLGLGSLGLPGLPGARS